MCSGELSAKIAAKPKKAVLYWQSMYCEKCATQLPDDAAFCSACSKPTSNAPKHITAAAAPQRRSFRAAWILLVAVLICIIIGLAVRQNNLEKEKVVSEAASTPAPRSYPLPLPPVPSYHEQKLVSGSIAVNAHSMYWVNFTIAPQMHKARVTGHFQTFGGRLNDIQAVICSEDDFTNFRNGHQAQVFYDSNKTTVGRINATLPDAPGRYVLAFNNSFSPLSGKTINGEVTLGFETLGQ
jgi:hypothetical protein